MTYAVSFTISIDVGRSSPSSIVENAPCLSSTRSCPVPGFAGEPGSWPGVKTPCASRIASSVRSFGASSRTTPLSATTSRGPRMQNLRCGSSRKAVALPTRAAVGRHLAAASVRGVSVAAWTAYDEGYLRAYQWAGALGGGAALPQEAVTVQLGPGEIAHARF